MELQQKLILSPVTPHGTNAPDSEKSFTLELAVFWTSINFERQTYKKPVSLDMVPSGTTSFCLELHLGSFPSLTSDLLFISDVILLLFILRFSGNMKRALFYAVMYPLKFGNFGSCSSFGSSSHSSYVIICFLLLL